MIACPGEKLLCAAALITTIVSCGWTWRASPLPPRPSVAVPANPAAYQPPAAKLQAPNPSPWNEPTAQSGGPVWVYDLFTPPGVAFDPVAHRLRVTAPAILPPPGEAVESFGLALRAITQPLFRLQLVGYAGEPGDLAGVFENTLHHEVILARAGQSLPGLGLRIQNLAAETIPFPAPENPALLVAGATARVRDERTGEEFHLTTAARHRAGPPVATLIDGRGDPHELQAGETISIGETTYHVDRITRAAVVVTKRSARLKSPQTVTLSLPSDASQSPR